MLQIIAAIAALFGLAKPGARIWVCVAGALVALDSGATGAWAKPIFLSSVVLSFLLSMNTYGQLTRKGQPHAASYAHIRNACLVYLLWLFVVPGGQAVVAGEPMGEWARTAIVFALPALFVPMAITEARSQSVGTVKAGLVVLTAIASLQFVVTWTGRRSAVITGVSDVYYGLGSKVALAACLAGTFALALHCRTSVERAAWLALSCFPVGSVLATGTRSGLLFAAVPLGCLVVYRLHAWLKALVGVALMAIVTWWMLNGLLAVSEEGRYAIERLRSVFAVLTGDQAFDESFTSGRLTINELTKEEFLANPIWGVGLLNVSFVDTFWVPFAKFGVVGASVLIYWLVSVVRHLLILGETRLNRSMIFGLVGYLVAINLVGTPFEDRGLGVALALVIILTLAGSASTPQTGVSPQLAPSRPK